MIATVRSRLRAWWRSRYETGRPLPAVGVGLGRGLPGWVLRAAFVAAVLALLLGTAARTTLVVEFDVLLALLVAGWAVARPGPAPAHVALVVAALLLLGSTEAPFDPAVLWLAPLGYVVSRLGWWASRVGATDRVELAALGRTAVRDGVVVVVSLAIGGAAWASAGRPVTGLVAVGVAALAALAWTVARRDDGEAR